MRIKLENKEIVLQDNWFKFLYPYLIRFCVKNQIDREWKNDIILVQSNKQQEFNHILMTALEDLLKDCYNEPSHKERSKYSSRYKKITLNNQEYVLNYRTDLVGILGYAIDYLITETRNA
jgi:hypothetical protein